MEIFLNILVAYYALVFVIVGIIGSLLINIEGDIYQESSILSDRQEFIRCIFMYQVAVWEFLRDELNIVGIVILEILTTLSVWFLNILILAILLLILLLKSICYLYWLIFRKRDDEVDKI